jgi:hypothetical protein
MFVAFVLFGLAFVVLGRLAVAAVIGLLIWALVGQLTRNHRASRFAGALTHHTCPDCDYELGAIPAAIPPSLVGGVNIGPAVCPECGSPWPLLPPMSM